MISAMLTLDNLPQYALTLQAPWWALLIWADKGRIGVENRYAGVAGQLRDYRGDVLLTASKSHKVDGKPRPFKRASGELRQDVAQDIKATLRGVREIAAWESDRPPINMGLFIEGAGHAVGVARVVGVLPPERNTGPWAADGQYGIVLRDVRPITPVPAIGAQGAWRPTLCGCGKAVATSARHTCKKG